MTLAPLTQERRIPVALRSVSNDFSLDSWSTGAQFKADQYFEAIHSIREQLEQFSAGAGDDWALIVQMLMNLTAKDGDLEDYVFAGNHNPGIDGDKWLQIAEAASWRALRQYHKAMASGCWSPT